MTDPEIRAAMLCAREEYIQAIRADMLGPGSEFSLPDAEHELIASLPAARYSLGILFPQGNLLRHDGDETITEDESLNESASPDLSDPLLRMASGTSDRPAGNDTEDLHTAEEEHGALDEEVGMATQYAPSSMGLTFLVQGDCETICGKVSFGTYRRARIEECILPFRPSQPDHFAVPAALTDLIDYDPVKNVARLKRSVTRAELRPILAEDPPPETDAVALQRILFRFCVYCRTGYIREPHEQSFRLHFSGKAHIDQRITEDDAQAHVRMVALRRRIDSEVWSVTIMMVNGHSMDNAQRASAEQCIFQAHMEIAAEENHFRFVDSNRVREIDALDDEERSLALLYRNKKTYGTGLGTSVAWDIDEQGRGTLWSEFLPVAEVPSVDFSLPPNDQISSEELSMKYLSDLDDTPQEEKLASLTKMVSLYQEWIDRLQVEAPHLDPQHQETAAKNIRVCQQACTRMYEGIEILRRLPDAYHAFLLANRAMFMQRIHIKAQTDMAAAKPDRYPDDEEISAWLHQLDYKEQPSDAAIWRPFQIAFLLMDVSAIVHDQSPERDLIDLIWFPTGGGKTEAYLGLTAFTIFYRRLAHPTESDGTAVMMRYTLRLLAAQQFTRAATLICACEYIRKDALQRRPRYPSYPLGNESITIGLWIGNAHTPNKNKDAIDHLEKLNDAKGNLDGAKERDNKFQVLKCPWCGTKMVKDLEKDGQRSRTIGAWGYRIIQKNGKHFRLFCPHSACDFHLELPIQIVDEELYLHPPTLLFATVDKFAMLPWEAQIGAFFAAGTASRAPELIIQDELHLISGTLGTIVGLFETAIDALCSQKGIPPKIIASTATIRRAKEQCAALYNRAVVQFPPPGLNADDSFFAKDAVIDHAHGKYGRKYVGIMPSGKTKAIIEIRLMAALLQRLFMMDLPDEVKDKLWTLTAYFNSLKELGKASTFANDDVKDFIRRTAYRTFTWARLMGIPDELTSRVSTTELNETLNKLEKTAYSKENIAAKKYASNVLLATNMISVGIDVARLNVMMLLGQPKLTSEYIQASSRVGRSYPGVVFVQYDATKSRDRSHYEHFPAYHASFYRFVEPTGATPFSRPARARALHSVVTAMLRHQIGLRSDNTAIQFSRSDYADEIRACEDFITDRVASINALLHDHAAEDTDELREEIEYFLRRWEEAVHACKQDDPPSALYFGQKFMVKSPTDGERRLLKAYGARGTDQAFETLTSMRHVDTPVRGNVIVWEGDNTHV